MPSGGDFFDVVELEEGFLAVVGDVTGKGVEAAALTALARYTLATAARFDPSPAAVVSLLNDVLVHRSDISLLTVVCAHVVPSSSGARLRLTSAGHPLPVLARAGHAPTTVGPPGLLLGMTVSAGWEETEVELAPGDTLLFYTDGVTDTPSGRERFGEERLLAAVPARAGRPPRDDRGRAGSRCASSSSATSSTTARCSAAARRRRPRARRRRRGQPRAKVSVS